MANKADNQIKWVLNKMPKSDDKQVANMSLEEMSKANNFHKSFPQYSVTPLTGLPHLAEYLGLKKLYVKDESYRFGLNAFKVLGGSYAIARYMAQQLGKDVSEVPYDVLTSEKLKEDFGQATFFTATDGNHGRGVAWAANKLGQKCVVRMPKGTTQTRLNNIAKENATVTIAHSRTKDLKEVTKRADIIVAAIGKAKFVTADYVKEGAVVIDVGMDRDENGKLCGDVDFESVSKVASAITPVPGGVGPMTVTMLLVNCLRSVELNK